MAAGNRFYDQGNVARAVAEWEKAAAFRPRDIELNKRLSAARNKLGNLNLKRSYLREASEEAARGNFSEALVLCRKALDLDPNDESALLVAKKSRPRSANSPRARCARRRKSRNCPR